MRKTLLGIVAVMLIASLGLAGCDAIGGGGKFQIGLVTDVGRVNDRSFNQAAWEGVELAVEELGAEAKYIETTDAKDYEDNIRQFAEEGYDVIVTVGFALGEATT